MELILLRKKSTHKKVKIIDNIYTLHELFLQLRKVRDINGIITALKDRLLLCEEYYGKCDVRDNKVGYKYKMIGIPVNTGKCSLNDDNCVDDDRSCLK